MATNERKRAAILSSKEIAVLNDKKLKQLRGLAEAMQRALDSDPPDLDQFVNICRNALKMLRPLSGEELRAMSDDGQEPTLQ